MIKILDTYIIKKYLITFLVTFSLFIPIGIMVDVAERIDKFKENEVPFNEIIDYYFDFMWYFGNLLFPILLFLSIIWFTSKLANNTEIISVLSLVGAAAAYSVNGHMAVANIAQDLLTVNNPTVLASAVQELVALQ